MHNVAVEHSSDTPISTGLGGPASDTPKEQSAYKGYLHMFSRKQPLRLQFGLAEGWFSLFLLSVIVYSTVGSVEAVGWVEHLDVLPLTTALGLIAGLIAAKQRRLRRLHLHLLAASGAVLIAFWQTARADYAGNVFALVQRIQQWLVVAFAGVDSSIFLLLITALIFALAYTSAWLVYRTRRPWLMIAANIVVLLIHLTYAASGYVVLLIVFLVASMLLLLRFNVYESVQGWRRQGLRHSDNLGWDFMQAGVLVSIGVVIFAWLLPWGYINATAAQFLHANSRQWIQLQSHWDRLVSVNEGVTVPNHGDFANTLVLGGNPNLTNDVVFTVQSDDGLQYLESLSYETYNGRSWTDGPTRSTSVKTSQSIGSESALWRQLQQKITVVNPPGEQYPYLLGATQIASVDQPAMVLTSATNGSVVAWLAKQGNLAQGEHYAVTSYISAADIQTLRSVPLPADSPTLPVNHDGPTPLNSYDPSIVSTYLQLPGNLDPNVKRLAQDIVTQAHATTMYDKAIALESYLRANYRYDVNIHLPAGEEGVSWFLFRSGHRGFCNYFSSAMTIMARLVGMPARVVTGYTNGHFDPQHNQWVIHGTDAHSWVQLYFAGYGWVNFEPSASFSSFVRPLPGSANTASGITPSGQGSIGGQNNPGRPKHLNMPDAQGSDVTSTPAALQAQWRQGVSVTLGSILLLVLLGLLLFGIWWHSLFRGRRASAQMYGRICLLGQWAGVPLRRWQTPYEYIRALTELTPAQATTLERFGDIYVRDLWADPASKEHPRRSGETGELPDLWKHLQPALFGYLVRHPYFLGWLARRRGSKGFH